ncbi:Maintenance of telomere capping protein [Lachnellula subtilissima]|uniref:Maintenance of telomere capping protein n=1 Tax=Lachnellula subtilissima TaxID=602034 RepID=A0A8H8RS24_9HELO|nr:Maintenance of telomere capping protein [Lachnellula subtilissima]
MATKKSKVAPSDDDLNKLLEGLGEDEVKAQATSKGASKAAKTASAQSEQDLLDELENLGAQKAPSRPHTPRVQSIRRTNTATPPPAGSTRTSEEKTSAARKSVDSTRSFHTSFTPSATSSDLQEAEKKHPVAQPAEAAPVEAGGGWWGGIFATASAAVKTAEAAVKEIQQNEEAKRWAEQVKGNVGALRGLGGELRSRALPTFTNILHTLAPPISSHERLQIHITHDFIGYPSLDPLIYSTFSRVMAQVEGGDLLVIQRGHEATARRNSEAGYTGGSGGWSDGPWWRQHNEHRDLGSVKGLIEGTKLVRVSAEAYSNEYFTSHGGLELAAQRATENLSESNPVRSSDIFLAVQAISHDAPEDLFQGPAKEKEEESAVQEKDTPDELVSFALYLHDPVHSITFHTITQSIPAKWIKWLDAPSPLTPASSTSPTHQKTSFFGREGEPVPNPNLPEEIAEIIESGGVDPREWVAEWVEELLSLGVGIVAQRYVARRMGVGEGGIGRGKARMEEVLEEGGGEAARAGLI